jgi:hypothetical protein
LLVGDGEERIHKTETIMNWKLNSIVSVARRQGTGAGERVRRRHGWRSLIAPVLAVCLCGPITVAWASPKIAQAALASGASPSTQPSRSPQTVGSETAQDSAYAAREGESKDLETFKGGEPVVIVTSTAVLIVAIILLIVLI